MFSRRTLVTRGCVCGLLTLRLGTPLLAAPAPAGTGAPMRPPVHRAVPVPAPPVSRHPAAPQPDPLVPVEAATTAGDASGDGRSGQDAPQEVSAAGSTGPTATPSVVDTALALLGVPYRPRGTTVAGFDCSGFTQYVFRQHGVMLPRDSQDQFTAGHAVPQDETRPGDLVFFRTGGRRISHVGIALGDGTFVHAPNARGVVRVERMTGDYWSHHFAGVRRISAAN